MSDEQASRGAARKWTRVLGIAGAVTVIALTLVTLGWSQLKRAMYEPGDRDEWQQPERVLQSLELARGECIADLGSGGGYFTFRFARAVAADGIVYAVDVDADMNDLVLADAQEQGLENVSTVLAAFDDPRLPEPVDWLFTSNTYHHLDDRTAYFSRVREKYLRPGGRIAIIEYKPEATDHSTARNTIVKEMEAAGFTLSADHDWLERQWFGVFTPKQ